MKRAFLKYLIPLILFPLILAGKLLHFPVALVIVSDSSTPPALRYGDLALGLHPAFREVRAGDVVLHCVDSLRTSCSTHEVESVSEGYVIVTSGPSSSARSLRIPKGDVSYVIVASAPIYAWIPLLLISMALYAAHVASLSRRLFSYASRSPGSAYLTTAIACLALNLVTIGAAYLSQRSPAHSAPLVRLVARELDLDRTEYALVYDFRDFRVVDALCTLENGTIAHHRLEPPSTIVVDLPEDFMRWLWKRDSEKRLALPSPPAIVSTNFIVACTVFLDRGLLNESYVVSFNWVEPEVRALGSSITIVNLNPVELNVTVRAIGPDHGGGVFSEEMTIGARSSYTLDLARVLARGRYVVRIYYEFLGSTRGLGVEVRV